MDLHEALGGSVLQFEGGPMHGMTVDVGRRAAWPIREQGGLYERRETTAGWRMVWRLEPSWARPRP